jgi:hypothetical protein
VKKINSTCEGGRGAKQQAAYKQGSEQFHLLVV